MKTLKNVLLGALLLALVLAAPVAAQQQMASRNGSGTMAVPNTFSAGTPAVAADVNENFDDIADEITNSVAADGQTNMTGALKAFSGTELLPGIAWNGDTNTGFRRSAADTMGVVVNGSDVATIDSTGISIEADLSVGDDLTVGGSADFAAAATVASATTTDLGAENSNTLTVSGTTTITGFGTADAGVERWVRFSGVLTLTHNGTSLILPGGVSITTAAGDMLHAKSEGSGNWRVYAYERANGRALTGQTPTTTTDNALPRFDGTAGALQTSGVTVDDSNNISTAGTYSSTATGANSVPTGTTAQRPTGAQGMIRQNTDLDSIEAHNGTGWRLLDRPLLHLRDVKAAGTDGGTFTQDAWQTRTLNTEATDEIGSTLSSNQFTLPAGTYEIDASAPALNVNEHKAKLTNITDGTDTIIGTTSRSSGEGASITRSVIAGRFTIAAQKTFAIQHRCAVTTASDGFGRGVAWGVSEVYTDVRIWRVY